eukprot:7031641-Pyramimonas_sp.AAC.1
MGLGARALARRTNLEFHRVLAPAHLTAGITGGHAHGDRSQNCAHVQGNEAIELASQRRSGGDDFGSCEILLILLIRSDASMKSSNPK